MGKNISIQISICLLLIFSSCSHEIEKGRWEMSSDNMDLLAVHSALLPDGNVLTLSYSEPNILHQNKGKAQVWDPRTQRAFEVINFNDWNPFCGGHCFLGNSKFLFVGGHVHGTGLHPSSADRLATFESGEDGDLIINHSPTKLEHRRWYPTVVTLANGNALIIGGSSPYSEYAWNGNNDDYEYYSVVDDYIVRQRETEKNYPRSEEDFDYPEGDERRKIDHGKNMHGLYPLTHLLPSDIDAPYGRLFVVTESFLRMYNPMSNTIEIERIDVEGFRTWKTMASSVLLPIDIGINGETPSDVKILLIGGGNKEQDSSDPAMQNCKIFMYNIEDKTLELIQEFDLTEGRIMGDGILLPDGNIVVVGGSGLGYSDNNSNKRLKPELILINDEGLRMSNSLFEAASEVERGYHATAILLQNGSIFTSGGNDGWDTGGPLKIDGEYVEHKSVETFYPPYIDEISDSDRPEIESQPLVLNCGDEIIVTTYNLDVVEQIVLMRHGSRTHALDTDQRMLRFEAQKIITTDIQGEEIAQLTARLPDNPTFYPPGPYSIFIFRNGGEEIEPQKFIPSEGKFVQVNNKKPINTEPQGEPSRTFLAQSVDLDIMTGNDNLEEGNEAWAEIFDVNNHRIMQIELADNSTELRDETLDSWSAEFDLYLDINDLNKITIRHTADNPEHINSDDWKVRSIRLVVNGIIAETGESISQTILDCEGSHLFKLSNDYKTKSFAFGVWGNCQ